MEFDEDELPKLDISLDYLELFEIYVLSYNAFEEEDMVAKLSAESHPLMHLVNIILKKTNVNPEKEVDLYAQNAVLFKNLRDKFEDIIRNTNDDRIIRHIDSFKKFKETKKK